MKNFITETELKGYIPELTKYLWTGETDFSKQKTRAEQIVISDLIDKGYTVRQLQTGLYLSETDGVEDERNGMRFVVNATAGTGTVTLLGSGDDDTYETATTLAITTTGETSVLFTYPYRYYKITLGGVTGDAYLIETNYDLLFAFKWLELIMCDSFKEAGDQYYTRMEYFRNMYNEKLGRMKITVDADEDGSVDETESDNGSIINYVR